jgi:hypothetical protein
VDADVRTTRLVGTAEVAVVNACRAVGTWRWFDFERLQKLVQHYRPHTPPRTTRHHLGRWVKLGLVRTDGRDCWQWNPNADEGALVLLDRACRAEGLYLEPVREPPDLDAVSG